MEEKFYQLYIVEQKTTIQAAKELGISKDVAFAILAKHPEWPRKKTPKELITGRKRKMEPNPLVHTKEWLQNEYHALAKTQLQIANESGLAKWTIQKLFEKYNIKPRPTKNKNFSLETFNKMTKEWLQDQHVNQKKSAGAIARENNTSDVYVLKLLTKYNIQKQQSSGNYIWNIFKDETEAQTILYQLNHVQGLSLTDIAPMYNVDVATVSLWFKKFNIVPKIINGSKEQREILSFIKEELNCNCVENDRSILDGREIDIFCPRQNVGVELNGLYWHNTSQKPDINYHYNKTLLAQSKNVFLFQFWDTEWNNKKQICKSMISYKLQKISNKIHGRKCIIKKVNQAEADIFYNNNHLQGTTNSKIHLGLYYKDSLVSLMSFNSSRFDKNIEYELTRFASILNSQVYGAASKLFQHFIKEYCPKNVVSYSDNRYSFGGLYLQLGFAKVKDIVPNYYYFIDKELKRKEHYRKEKLNKFLPNYDSNLTEFENMDRNGHHRVYDCGKQKFLYTK